MKHNQYDYIFFTGLLLWLGSSAYFGWNKEPINVYEEFADLVSLILMSYGFLNSLVRGIKTEITFKVKNITLDNPIENEKEH